jgi:hypothetical protein
VAYSCVSTETFVSSLVPCILCPKPIFVYLQILNNVSLYVVLFIFVYLVLHGIYKARGGKNMKAGNG